MQPYWEIRQLFFMCYIIISSTFCYPLFFMFRKIFMTFSTILTLFFSWERFSYLSRAFLLLLVFFFLGKILIPFTSFFSKPSFIFLIISSLHFYICEKNIWLIFYTLKTTLKSLDITLVILISSHLNLYYISHVRFLITENHLKSLKNHLKFFKYSFFFQRFLTFFCKCIRMENSKYSNSKNENIETKYLNNMRKTQFQR